MNLCNALLFISLIQCSCSYNILVYVLLIGKSHVDFGTMLVNLLADRGHTVVSSLKAKQSINSLFILTQSWRKYFEDLMFARMNDQVSGNGTSKARRIKNFGWEGIGESLVLNCQNNFFMKGPWSQRAAYLSSFFEPQPFSLDDISAFYDTTNDHCYLAMSDPSVV